jgi:cell division protein FtsQ
MRAALLALDPVEDAEVRVRSGVLELRVTERVPAIVWLDGGTVAVLDARGHRVGTLDGLDDAGALPIVSGDGAGAAVPEALRLFDAAGPLTEDLVGFTRVGMRRWDVVLTEGRRIALPEAGPVAALDRMLALDAAQEVLGRDVRLVDLRLPGRPTLRLSEPARAELRELQVLERLSYTEDR